MIDGKQNVSMSSELHMFQPVVAPGGCMHVGSFAFNPHTSALSILCCRCLFVCLAKPNEVFTHHMHLPQPATSMSVHNIFGLSTWISTHYTDYYQQSDNLISSAPRGAHRRPSPAAPPPTPPPPPPPKMMLMITCTLSQKATEISLVSTEWPSSLYTTCIATYVLWFHG